MLFRRCSHTLARMANKVVAKYGEPLFGETHAVLKVGLSLP
jgi:hypothetical protein